MGKFVSSLHGRDENGNPAGGETHGLGIEIRWQNGPLAVDGERRPPNGAFVDGVIEAAIDRLRFYQGEGHYGEHEGAGRFRCRENALAITHLEEALHWLNHRTADREERGVEGTHEL